MYFHSDNIKRRANYSSAAQNLSRGKRPIQDCGATNIFFRQSDSHYLSNVKPGGGLTVGLPNGAAIRSVATGILETPPISTKAHIFSDTDLDRSLVSTAEFCNQGCTATLTATSLTIVHDATGTIVAHSTKDKSDRLWPAFQHNDTPLPSPVTANLLVRHEINADFVAYFHATMGSPPDSSMERALRAGYFSNVDRITAKMFRDNQPNSVATAKGHLDQSRKGIQSTTKTRTARRGPPSSPPQALDVHDDCDLGPEQAKDAIVFQVRQVNENSSDLTGRFPYISRQGFQYMLISIYRGYIHVELMKDRSAAEYVRAFRLTYFFFHSKSHKPEYQSLDNETSTAIETFLRDEANVKLTYVPADTHRRLRAERAIRSWKNHLLATMATTDKDFPKNAWDLLIPQAELTLAHLRPYSLDRSISTYEGIHGAKFDFSAHPIHVLGVRTVALTPADKRESWGPHGIDCFYIGPAINHYRCYIVFAPATNATRIADTISWHQTKVFAPGASTQELLYNKQVEIASKLDAMQIIILNNPNYAHDPALQQLLAGIRATEIAQAFASPDAPAPSVTEPAPTQRVAVPAQSQRVADTTPAPHPTESTARQRQRIKAAETKELRENPNAHFYKPMPRISLVKKFKPFYDYRGLCFTDTMDKQRFQITDIVTPTAPKVKRVKRGRENRQPVAVPYFKYFDTSKFTSAPLRTTDYEFTPCVEIVGWDRTAKTFSRVPRHIVWDTVETSNVTGWDFLESNNATDISQRGESLGTQYIREGLSTFNAIDSNEFAFSTYHSSPDDPRLNVTPEGKPLTMRSALSGPDSDLWRAEQGTEITRLLASETMKPILRRDQPHERRRDTTYYNPQVKEKLDADRNIKRRVRGTLGGDRINFPDETTSPVADIAAVKILFASVVSDRRNKGTNTKFATIDLTDFYLGSKLPRPEYVRIKLKDIPLETIALHSLEQYIEGDSILFQVDGSMYGHPVAGRISNQDLVKHLATHGYVQDDMVPCLFTHATNGIQFTLVVDDLGIKHIEGNGGLQHLQKTLELKWKTKLDYSGSKYLGIRIDWHYDDPKRQHLFLDMPTTVPDAIKRFCPDGPPRGAKSPIRYVPPTFGAKTDLGATVDTSPPVPLESKKFIQQVAGVFLHYSRMIDATMIPAVRAISDNCANPTEHTLEAADHLIRYAVAHPNHRVRIDACDMILTIQSDASHLSLTKSGSVAGGVHYLTNKGAPFVINGIITPVCCRIPTVCTAASESEYGALYINGQQGIFERECLRAVGYPQEPTAIYCDNTTAIDIANDTCKMRRSKATEARYHWTRCRVRRNIYKIAYLQGSEIDADFFTKTQPVKRHIYFIGRFVHPPAATPGIRASPTSPELRTRSY